MYVFSKVLKFLIIEVAKCTSLREAIDSDRPLEFRTIRCFLFFFSRFALVDEMLRNVMFSLWILELLTLISGQLMRNETTSKPTVSQKPFHIHLLVSDPRWHRGCSKNPTWLHRMAV